MTAELVCAASDRDAWLAARRTGVTATDIVTILGLGPSSEYALYWEKVGKLPPWEGNARTRLGTVLEDYAWGLWLQAQEDWAGWSKPREPALFRNAERPWQLATPDRNHPVGPVELKTWDDHDRDAWADGMPPRVRAQVLWQMDTLGVGTGHVGVLFLPSGEFESRMIEHGRDFPACYEHQGHCAECDDQIYMRAQGESFWSRVRQERPPFPDGSPATLRAVKALHAGVLAGEREIDAEMWRAWDDARHMVKVWEENARQSEAALRELLGDAETGTIGGEPVVKRTRYEVAGKTIERKPYVVDKLTRLGARNGDSDGAEADHG